MEHDVAALINSIDSKLVFLVVKAVLAFIVTTAIKNFAFNVLRYFSTLISDTQYGVVYAIEDQMYTLDKVTFRFVILRNVSNNRINVHIPITTWAETTRTIVMTGSVGIQNVRSTKNEIE